MKKINKNIIIITLLLFVTILCALLICKIVKQDNDIQKYSEQKLENIPTTEKVIKNIIFMIGDGMGEKPSSGRHLPQLDHFTKRASGFAVWQL